MNSLVFAYFTGAGERGLHLATSRDGLKWSSVNDGKTVLLPLPSEDETKKPLMRDPFIMQSPDCSCYHLLFTTGWTGNDIGYSKSNDLITWDPPRRLAVMPRAEVAADMHKDKYLPGIDCKDSKDKLSAPIQNPCSNCWAPKACWDPHSSRYMVMWSSTIAENEASSTATGSVHEVKKDPGIDTAAPGTGTGTGTRRAQHILMCWTSDFASFTEPSVLYAPEGAVKSVIDALLFHRGNRWALCLKDETDVLPAQVTTAALHVLWGPVDGRPDGPWRGPLGAHTQISPAGVRVEGPAALVHACAPDHPNPHPHLRQCRCYVYADAYVEKRFVLISGSCSSPGESSSGDIGDGDKQEQEQEQWRWQDESHLLVGFPHNARHGSICAVTDRAADALLAAPVRDAYASCPWAGNWRVKLSALPPPTVQSDQSQRESFPGLLEQLIRSFAAGTLPEAALALALAGGAAAAAAEDCAREDQEGSAGEEEEQGEVVIELDATYAVAVAVAVAGTGETLHSLSVRCRHSDCHRRHRSKREAQASGTRVHLHLPAFLDSQQRREVHVLCDEVGIGHPPEGAAEQRHIVLVALYP